MLPPPPVYATFVDGLPPKFKTLPLFDADLVKTNVKDGAAFAKLVEESEFLDAALIGSSYQALVDLYRDDPLATEGKQIALVGRLPSISLGNTRYIVLPDYMSEGMEGMGNVSIPLGSGLAPTFVSTVENSTGTSSKSVFTIVLLVFVAVLLLSILIGYGLQRKSQMEDREIHHVAREESVPI